MSVELLSLLLTGHVHSKLSGWCIDGLGFGLLSHESDKVSSSLTRPDQPIWIICDGNSHSVLWLDRSKSEDISLSKENKPGSSFFLVVWKGWKGGAGKSGMRIITDRKPWFRPTITQAPTYLERNKSVIDAIVERRRNEASRNVVSSDEQEEESDTVTEEEMQQVTVHPDDQKYYPGAFKRWRFSIGDSEQKLRSPVRWTPFFKLSEREKQIVETKLAPKISRILWTRWPKATIDSFTTKTDES
jgi:hypothetical protein